MLSHVIPQCLVKDRIQIKLQLTGKSRLIFKFSLAKFQLLTLVTKINILAKKRFPLVFLSDPLFSTSRAFHTSGPCIPGPRPRVFHLAYRRFHGRGHHLGCGANKAKFIVNVWEKS